MKIVITALGFGEHDNLGGSARVASMNAKELCKAGHEVLFICTNRKDKKTKLFPGFKRLITNHVEVLYLDTITIPFWPGDFGPHFVYFPNWLKRRVSAYEIIHCNEYRSYLSLKMCSLGKKFKIPIIMQPHGTMMFHGNRIVIKYLYNFVFNNFIKNKINSYIASTITDKILFINEGIDEEKIHIIPNGYSIPNNPSNNDTNFRNKYLNNNSNPYILSIGRLDPLKGFNFVIEALKFIPNNYLYVIIGPDQQDYSIVLKNIAKSLGVESRVVLTGGLENKDDLWFAMKEAEMLIVPSLVESFGMVILEGAIAEVALVISNKCNIANDLPGDTALIVNPLGYDISIASNLLITNDSFKRKLIKNALEFIKENYNVKVVIEKLISLYKRSSISS